MLSVRNVPPVAARLEEFDIADQDYIAIGTAVAAAPTALTSALRNVAQHSTAAEMR